MYKKYIMDKSDKSVWFYRIEKDDNENWVKARRGDYVAYPVDEYFKLNGKNYMKVRVKEYQARVGEWRNWYKWFCAENHPYFLLGVAGSLIPKVKGSTEILPVLRHIDKHQQKSIGDQIFRDQLYVMSNSILNKGEVSLSDWARLDENIGEYPVEEVNAEKAKTAAAAVGAKAAAAAVGAKAVEAAKPITSISIMTDPLNVNNDDTPSSEVTRTDCARVIKINMDTDPPTLTIKNKTEPQEITIPADYSRLTIVFCTGFTEPDSNNNVLPIYKKIPYTDKATFEKNMIEAIYDKKEDEKLTQRDHSLYVVFNPDLRPVVFAALGLKLGGARRKSKKVKKSRKSRKSRKSIKNRKTKYSKK